MAKADTQKAKGEIWWQSARTFGQKSNPTTWRLARMNPCVTNPKSEIRNPKLNGWGGDRLREDARWKFGVPPAGNANFACVQHFLHPLAPTGMAGFILANGSMSSNQSGEGEIRKAIIEADLVDCMVALRRQDYGKAQQNNKSRIGGTHGKAQ